MRDSKITLLTFVTVFVLLSLLINATGCGKGDLQSVEISSKTQGSISEELGERLLLEGTGHIDSSLFGNHIAVHIDTETKMLIMSLPTPNIFLEGVAVEIPDLPGVRIISYVDSEERGFVEVHYPLELLFNRIEMGKPNKLPNGDPLPAIAGGELPYMNVDLPLKDLSARLYVGPAMIALYLEVPFDPHVKASVPISTKADDEGRKRILGYITTIPEKSTFRGGLFISAILPDEIARELDKVF